MDKKEILYALWHEVSQENGEILGSVEEGFQYYDYEESTSNVFITIRDDAHCTRKDLLKMIYVSKNAAVNGITAEHIADIVNDAYSDNLPDAMRVLRGIAVLHNKADIEGAIRFFFKSKKAIDEVLKYDMRRFYSDDLVGKTWHCGQMAFIFEGEILDSAMEFEDDMDLADEFYSDGIGITVIHELRHIMLDCNPILHSHDIHDAYEDAVEEFSRDRWNEIRRKYMLKIVNKKKGVVA